MRYLALMRTTHRASTAFAHLFTLGATAVALSACAVEQAEGDTENVGQTTSALVDTSLTVTTPARKCVDVGGDAFQTVGSPVFIYGCNGTSAQKIRVVELADGTHDVSLRASKGLCLGVRGGTVAAARALELQACNASLPTQRFALDGDTIFVGTQASGRVVRDLVVEVDHGRGANRTPLVVGTRELDDAEDFRFGATSFAALFPTSGFKMVMSRGDLDRALAASHWGSVIEVAPDTTIVLDDAVSRDLRSGVTLRGNRRGTVAGPEIFRSPHLDGVAFGVTGDNVRVTGLRLRGYSTSTDDGQPMAAAILSDVPAYRALVDHNEMSGWTDSAVKVQGTNLGDVACYVGSPSAQNVRVIANYIHDNARQNSGYGVVSSYGGNPYIDGNVFARNRHAIAADNNGHTSYTAKFNMVLESNTYCSVWPICWKEQDFDAHGTGDGDHYQGGRAGYLFEMASNTFYPHGKVIDIRGTPCNLARITDNVFVMNDSAAIKNATEIDYRVQIASNTYPATAPTTVVGDFDGDGVQDEFVGTGAAWYYRPGRTADWRLLNRFNERTAQLTFGDFDGDGRTDARVTAADGTTQTSWGGSSPWDVGRSRLPGPIFGGSFEPVTVH